jgi:hypothetical protein
MKKTVIAKHCDDRPKEVILEEGDKMGFICEKCHGLFEVNSDGEVTRAPIEKCRAVANGFMYSIIKGHFIDQGDVYK